MRSASDRLRTPNLFIRLARWITVIGTLANSRFGSTEPTDACIAEL